MKVQIRKLIGNSTFIFDVEEGKVKDALFTAAGLASIPEMCTVCKSKNVQLSNNKGTDKNGKAFSFVKVRCLDCTATSQMGEYLDGVNVFWKQFEKWTPEGTSTAQVATKPVQPHSRVEVDNTNGNADIEEYSLPDESIGEEPF